MLVIFSSLNVPTPKENPRAIASQLFKWSLNRCQRLEMPILMNWIYNVLADWLQGLSEKDLAIRAKMMKSLDVEKASDCQHCHNARVWEFGDHKLGYYNNQHKSIQPFHSYGTNKQDEKSSIKCKLTTSLIPHWNVTGVVKHVFTCFLVAGCMNEWMRDTISASCEAREWHHSSCKLHHMRT